MAKKIRIAHLAGPNATIQNTPPLVTSNKARAQTRIAPPHQRREGEPSRFDPSCGRKSSQRRQRSMSSSSAPIRSSATSPSSTRPPDGFLAVD